MKEEFNKQFHRRFIIIPSLLYHEIGSAALQSVPPMQQPKPSKETENMDIIIHGICSY